MNPYATLGLTKDTATPERVKRAYRKRAAVVHPDNPDTGDRAAFEQLNRAQKLLCDANAKRIYDETGIVSGEDRLAEEAIMLIVQMSGEILAKNPECDLVVTLRASLDQMMAQAREAGCNIDACIARVEKRWRGAESVKDVLLMNMHAEGSRMNRKIVVCTRAKELLRDAAYDAPAQKIDELMSMFYGRRQGFRT